MGKLKVGVFGAYRGSTMIGVLSKHPDAELVAVCDKYEPLLKKCREQAEAAGTKLAQYTDFEDFFRHDMDAVVLANYANQHAPYAVRFLRSGRHVLSEVLPVQTMAEAVQLVEAVEETGNIYAYAENYCYMKGTFEMWRRYKRGDIGEIMHGEGEYVHDCASIWPQITYGERNHWRNRMYSTYYCTHSIGPVLTISGRRPVRVVGFETPGVENLRRYGSMSGTSGMIVMQLDNGATVKSLHGGLKREPGSINYVIYGQKGMMETERFGEALNVYLEGERTCRGKREIYVPDNFLHGDMAKDFETHGGSDFYPTHLFLQRILGREEGIQYGIDVYTALDMGIPGILAYRSILNGNMPYEVPNFRIKAEREPYRDDRACTDPAVAGEQLIPPNAWNQEELPDEVYARVREMWKNNIEG